MAQESVELTEGVGTPIATKRTATGENVQQVEIVEVGADGKVERFEVAKDQAIELLRRAVAELTAESKLTNMLLASSFPGIDLEQMRRSVLEEQVRNL